MKRDPVYGDAIKDTGSDRFWVFYGTKLQKHIYKEYIRLHKNSAFVSFDATGGVVAKLRRGNEKSGNIFLYTAVINFRGITCAAWQMLSERHDTEFITLWLKQWLRDGVPIPPETVCDYSRALLNAISFSFNQKLIKVYVNNCFLHLLKDIATTITAGRPAKTFIRIDVAHLIHAVSLWKCCNNVSHREIKDFYITCVALMVDCKDFHQLKDIFLLTSRVSIYSERQLEQFIEFWNVAEILEKSDFFIDTEKGDNVPDLIQHDNIHDDADAIENEDEVEYNIMNWIENIQVQAKVNAD